MLQIAVIDRIGIVASLHCCVVALYRTACLGGQATADRRRRTNPGSAAAGVQALGFGRGSSGGGQGEQCPQCGASFDNVGSLVAHVEAFHSEVSQCIFRAP